MPWVVKKEGDKFCVFKKGSDSPVKCHASRADATRHMRALYANVKEFSEVHVMGDEDRLCSIVPLTFSEKEVVDGKLRKWFQAIPFGSWSHPLYGQSYFEEWQAENMVRNFNEGVHGRTKLTTDYDHGLDPAKGGKASGVILELEKRTDGLYQHVEFTEEATREILAGEWNYWSPEYHDIWEDPMSGVIHSDVVRGGALTNKPWLGGMVPINLSEVMVEKGAVVEGKPKNEAVEQEHADPGEPHEIEVATEEQDDKSGGGDTGSRVDTPPDIQVENKVEVTNSVEINAKMREALGLPEDADEAAVEAAIVAMATEIAPLREAARTLSEKKAFSELYPTEAAELVRLRERDIENGAKLFSEHYRRFDVKIAKKDADGEDQELVLVKGFSGAVCDKLEEIHKQFSEGAATVESVKEVLDLIASGEGVVEYGERGTSVDSTGEAEAANPQEAARLLSEAAQKLVDEAGGPDKISIGDAIAQAARANPELAKLYNERTAGREG
jgi:hypothetical protein